MAWTATAEVVDGAIAVTGTDVEAGINYVARIRTLRPEMSTQGGSSMTRIRRVVDASVRFYCCGPGWRINQLETDLTGAETRQRRSERGYRAHGVRAGPARRPISGGTGRAG